MYYIESGVRFFKDMHVWKQEELSYWNLFTQPISLYNGKTGKTVSLLPKFKVSV
jgi:hypothetical protein